MGERTSRYAPGGGLTYLERGWDRVLAPKNDPSQVVIASFDDHGENTAVAPTCIAAPGNPDCPLADPTSEPWPSARSFWELTIDRVARFKAR